MENENKISASIGGKRETSAENEAHGRCRIEIYDQSSLPWESIREEILGIELSAFGPEKAFDEKMLKMDFKDPKSVIVLARDKNTSKIVGFTYAKSTAETYPEDYPERENSVDTAYIYDTAFAPEYQGEGLVSPLMKELERQLVSKGYRFLERDAANTRDGLKAGKETYADKIRRNYQGRILKEEAHDSEYGPQIFFRMRLGDDGVKEK